MKDWKTTISGLVAAVVVIAKGFGIEIPQAVSDGILAIAMFLMGFFASDKQKA